MLRRLSISNFKAFKGLHAINLSPITLICGPNSSGKSSVIQSIMLIKQSLASPGDYGGLVSNGQFVDLGSYKSMVNEHDDTKSIEMVFDFDAPEEVKNSALGFNRMFGNGHARRVSLSYGLFQTELSDDAEAFTYLEKVGFSIFLKKSKSDESQGFFLKSKLLEKKSSNYSDASRQFVLEDEVSKRQFSNIISKRLKFSENDTRKFENLCNELIFTSDATYATPSTVKIDPEMGNVDGERLFSFAYSNHAVNILSAELHDKFSDIAYLGPLRSYPSRLYSPKGEQSNSVGKLGEHAARLLHQNPKLRCKVNDWFSRFEIPYSISTENIGNEITGMVISLQLKDKRTNVVVGPSDVGFGIGQLLPIIVEGLVRRNSSILVEQPEIHLHPKLQANIADFLIDTIPKDKNKKDCDIGGGSEANNQWIVETHSESLILRLQRRIREGCLDHNDVSIIYVDPDDLGGNISSIKMDENGDFIDEWPEGFFEERLHEIFGG